MRRTARFVDADGHGDAAEREANLRKARELDAIIVQEFVDAGESARKADRPELMRMIVYVKTHHAAYCIVHKVDRLARNRADDSTIHLALKEAEVMLVSATTANARPCSFQGIEAAVEDYYRQVQIPEHIITALRELITAEFDRLHATVRQERHAYTAERDALRAQRTKLLQAHSAGAVPLNLLAS